MALQRLTPFHAAVAACLRRPADGAAGQDLDQERRVKQHHHRRQQGGEGGFEQEAQHQGGAAAEAVKQRVLRTVNQAKVRISETGTRVRGAANDAARATDSYVQDNPWRAIGYGAAVGALVALLATAILRRD